MEKTNYLKIRKAVNFEIHNQIYYEILFQDIASIGLVTALWTIGALSGLKFLAPFLIASILFRNFSLMHDASHGLVNNNSRLNHIFGMLSGIICLLPFEPWKESHLQHHHWSGNIEKDPVMAFLIKYPNMSKMQKRIFNIIWKSWFPILGITQNVVFWSLAAHAIKKNSYSLKSILNFIIPISCWGALIFTANSQFLIQGLLPGLFLYFVAVEVVNLPHHLQTPYFIGDYKSHAWNQHETARTCLYPKWIAKNIVLNFNYHIEHHLFPDAPWYCLPQLHKQVKYELNEKYQSDPYFAWILKNKLRSVDAVLYGAQEDQDTTKVAS